MTDVEKALAAARGVMPRVQELASITARIHREMYDAYLAEGFTPDQALALLQTYVSSLTKSTRP
jgi:hypothetical protein